MYILTESENPNSSFGVLMSLIQLNHVVIIFHQNSASLSLLSKVSHSNTNTIKVSSKLICEFSDTLELSRWVDCLSIFSSLPPFISSFVIFILLIFWNSLGCWSVSWMSNFLLLCLIFFSLYLSFSHISSNTLLCWSLIMIWLLIIQNGVLDLFELIWSNSWLSFWILSHSFFELILSKVI